MNHLRATSEACLNLSSIRVSRRARQAALRISAMESSLLNRPLRVSVVIPTYNGSHHLARLLKCFRESGSADIIEIFICDDGSTEDLFKAVLHQYPDLPIVHLRQERSGECAAKARNMGIMASRGDVILFLDQDVVFSQGFLESHLHRHRQTKRAQLVFGFRQRLPIASESYVSAHLQVGFADDHRRGVLGANAERMSECETPWYYVYSCNCSISTSLGRFLFDESFVGWGNEDLEYAYRLGRSGFELVCAPEASVIHIDEGLRDPFDNESRNQPADFTSFVINTVRFLAKYPDDGLLTSTLRADLSGFSIVNGKCIRDRDANQVARVIDWALQQSYAPATASVLSQPVRQNSDVC